LKRKRAEERRKKLAGWAFSQNYNFDPSRNGHIDDIYPQFKCLRHGNERYGYNIIEGTFGGLPFRSFDYHYETHSTDSKGNRQTQHHYFSAVAVDAALPLKPLFIRNERIFDKLAEFVGFDDIDFESTEFSKQFYVKSPDKKWAYDVLHQATMEFLLASPRFYLELQGCHVMAYRNNTFTLEDIAGALQVISGILHRLPESLQQELKEVR